MADKTQTDPTESREDRLSRLPPAARRALKEAEARRREYERRAARMPREIGGRGGEEPVRYGDWEVDGRATDF